jgi:hypothetical protein
VWTWKRLNGSEYEAGAIPALWRRVVDRPDPVTAHNEFGPLANDKAAFFAGDSFVGDSFIGRDDLAEWQSLHQLLTQVARLWRVSAEAPEIYALDTFQLPRDPAIEKLRVAASQAAVQGEIAPRLVEWRLQLQPMSLRAGLLMGCVSDIADRRRFRRCDHCTEWFPLARSDARFCSSACRQAAHIAGKEK